VGKTIYFLKSLILILFFIIWIFFIDMALVLHLLNLEQERRQRIGRIFRDRCHPLELHTDREMMRRYRLDRGGILYVLEAVKPLVERRTRRSKALNPDTIVFCALRYYEMPPRSEIMGIYMV
jgi:hypothetical protein